MKIVAVEPQSIADDLGIRPGDQLLEINNRRVNDSIDLRFHEDEPDISVKIAREGEVTIFEIEKGEGERLGIDLEEMKILSCGNDCIFCFVDQNPKGLRQQLYFRDGDYRLSFMYGNYTTMTNAGPAILQRIVDQRLSPQYISVHVTDYEVRKRLMGLKKDDRILEKIRFLRDHGIAMHTQIVLCPGINDGDVLEKTVFDLFRFRDQIVSLAVVPVGLTDHRFGLEALRKVDAPYADALLDRVGEWQVRFRRETGRAFIYPSDEFFIVAAREIPPARAYDGFPQIENGVGIVRSFIMQFRRQAGNFPARIAPKKKITFVTAELASGFMRSQILPRLEKIAGLEVALKVAPNTLYGRSVTVAGLLSGKCVYSALEGKNCGDLVLLPPDILNADGLFLDDSTVQQLEDRLGVPIRIFDGRWADVFTALRKTGRSRRSKPLLPGNPHAQQV
jgi:putative radical SAM enzyme (TIGR03279 family)